MAYDNSYALNGLGYTGHIAHGGYGADIQGSGGTLVYLPPHSLFNSPPPSRPDVVDVTLYASMGAVVGMVLVSTLYLLQHRRARSVHRRPTEDIVTLNPTYRDD